ncbi:TPA: phage tail protein [Streptococcus suis]
MLTFLDHKGNEIGALTTFNYTNSVNGERSLSGTVHGNLEIEKGWGVRFEDEYYKVIYAKPKSLGKINIVQFDAVHQFFWDFDKTSVYSELDGSYPFQTFLDHIFNGSGYRYNLEVEVGSLRKQNFGLKKRLELFNDLIKHAGVEFQVRGKVVRILERTGTDLSTVVRKKLNLNDLSIEKRIGDFITYQKGLGAWHDENDHSKGRLEVEYVSPLAAIYGRLEGEPYVDERFTIAENFLAVLKKSVENSYSISVQLAMEDLQKAGYRYTRPLAGDYITVIDEDINFKERVRIVSFETKYDIKGQVIDHAITCNDIGSVKKQSAGYSSLKSSVANVSKETESAIQTANRALVSADGKTTVYFGSEFPQDVPKGTLTKGDTLYLTVGDTTKMYYWNGAEWIEPPVVNDVEKFKRDLAEEITQVNQTIQAQSEEHDRQVADILSKTQSVESLANQAKSDAASALARANQVKTEAIADARAQIATVSQALNTAKSELQTVIASADQKARDSQASATALRNDLNLQASKILEQARAQTDLTSRVSTVETLADGTRSTVAELSKTVSKATGDITSVTSRTKTVEDTLSQTRTQYEALTQTVNTQTGQIESINRKTADLQSGIDGVTERFESLQVGGANLLSLSKAVKGFYKFTKGENIPSARYAYGIPIAVDNKARYVLQAWSKSINDFSWIGAIQLNNEGRAIDNSYLTVYPSKTSLYFKQDISILPNAEYIQFSFSNDVFGDDPNLKIQFEKGSLPTDYKMADEDLRSEIATYVRNATENSAELVRRIETADGKAVDAKTYAQQTATVINTRLESLETYKDGESTRASQYLTASRTETAKQLTAERTSIANNYVAKSIYDENVRGTTSKLNEIKSTADTAKQNLATYQETVDRKLTELTSSTQTLDGKINTASAKVDTVAGQIRTELTRVEGKIPSDLGGRNYILKSDVYATSGSRYFDTSPEFIDYAYSGKYVTISLDIKGENLIPDSRGLSRIGCELRLNLSDGKVLYLQCQKIVSGTQPRERISVTRKIPEGVSVVSANKVNMYIQVGGTALAGRPKFELSSIPSDWSAAPEDINSELNSTKTLITQTAEGQTQLSNRLTTTQDKVSTAETKINQLIGDVSSKVSQTDYNTLTGRVDDNETAITQNAQEISKRLTSTQVEQAITDKGYQTKSDVDNNITGRGYITSSALEPYALSTAVQNLVKETADSFSRTISETKALIPSGESNLVKWGRPGERSEYLNAEITTHPFFYNGGVRMYIIRNTSATNEKLVSFNRFSVERNTDYTLYFKGFNNSATVSMDVWFLKRTRGSSANFDEAQRLVAKHLSRARAEEIVVTFNTGNFDEGYLRFDNNGSTAEGSSADLYFGDISVKKGKSNNGWSPSVEELATVTALHAVIDTVDSHTRTIGAVGETGSILDNVSKVTQTAAGLVQEVSGTNGLKTQVSTLAGSYAIKNLTTAGDVLGQINLNPDGSVRINEGLISIGDKTYIKNGVIKSAMIGKGEIGTAHIGEIDAGIAKIINLDVSNIKGLDAEFIKAKIENALIGWLRGKTISAVNNVTTFDLTTGLITVNNNQSGFLFKDGNSVVGRIGYGNITRLGIGLSKGIDIYTNKNHSLALGYEMTNGMYSTAIQVDGGSGEVRIASPIYLSDKIYPLATKSYGYLRLDPFGNSGLKLTRNSGNGIAFDDTDVYIIVNGNTYSFKQWIINRR